jgi:hypothetical protein
MIKMQWCLEQRGCAPDPGVQITPYIESPGFRGAPQGEGQSCVPGFSFQSACNRNLISIVYMLKCYDVATMHVSDTESFH